MSQERIEQGLLDVAKQLEVKQREFAEKQGIRLYGEQMGTSSARRRSAIRRSSRSTPSPAC